MTNKEIAHRYIGADSPRKAIKELAEENGCTQKEIAAALMQEGQVVPKWYYRDPPAEKPVAAPAQQVSENAAETQQADDPGPSDNEDPDPFSGPNNPAPPEPAHKPLTAKVLMNALARLEDPENTFVHADGKSILGVSLWTDLDFETDKVICDLNFRTY